MFFAKAHSHRKIRKLISAEHCRIENSLTGSSPGSRPMRAPREGGRTRENATVPYIEPQEKSIERLVMQYT